MIRALTQTFGSMQALQQGLIALFDARVAATIAKFDLSGVKTDIEPFKVGDAQTFGGYFEFQKRDLY